MFYLDNNSGVSAMPQPAAQQSAAPRWFTEGNGSAMPSWPGQDWFNIVQAELLNVLATAGIAPEKQQLNQLALAVKAIVRDGALLQQNLLGEIKQAGASAQKTARANLGLGSAAVCDAGAREGQLLSVGTFGLGAERIATTGIDFNTYFFRGGETLFIAMARSTNIPPALAAYANNYLYATSVGVRDMNHGCAVLFTVYDHPDQAFLGTRITTPGEWRIMALKQTAQDTGALPLTGGTLSGDLEIKDFAPILKLSETDTDRNYQLIADGGTFRINRDNTSSATRILQYTPDNNVLLLPPEVVTTSANSLRMVRGDYGAFWRNDGSCLYLMLTNKGDPYGGWNAFRPLKVNFASGETEIARLVTRGPLKMATATGAGSWDSQYGSSAPLHQTFETDITTSIYVPISKQNVTKTQTSTGPFSYAVSTGTLIDQHTVAWSAHIKGSAGQSYIMSFVGANGGELRVPACIVPGSYSNFDNRYPLKINGKLHEALETVSSQGAGSWDAQYNNGAPLHQTFTTDTPSSIFVPICKQNVTKVQTSTGPYGFAVSSGALLDQQTVSWAVHLKGSAGHSFGMYFSARNNGELTVPGRMLPGDYGNFDSRYQAKNSALKAANGWHLDTSTGVIQQWGVMQISANSYVGTVTLPRAFPNACTAVSVTCTTARGDNIINLSSKTNTKLGFGCSKPGLTLCWIAIGY